MNDQDKLCFEVGPLQFCVDAPLNLHDDIASMFSEFRRLDEEPRAAEIFTIAWAESEAESWTIVGPNVPSYAMSTRAVLLDALISGVNLSILDVDPGALHLHAAAAAKDGHAVLVVGASGSGKTTLAATLASAGWEYITDEMVRLLPGESLITGFPKPLSVRASGADLVQIPSGEIPTSPEEASSLQISPSQLGARTTASSTPKVLLICSGLATHRRGAQPGARRISYADAVVALMGQTMDAERFGSGAVEVLSNLAAGCGCFAFEVGDPVSMTKLISDMVNADHAHVAPPVEAVSASGQIAADVLTVLIGDEAVVHHPSSGLVIALDPPAAVIWRRLADLPLDGAKVDLEGPVESKFVARLVSMGLVEQR